jgi:hypothetical protein
MGCADDLPECTLLSRHPSPMEYHEQIHMPLTGSLSHTPLHCSTLRLHAYFEVIIDILFHFESIDFVAMAQLAATTKTYAVGE